MVDNNLNFPVEVRENVLEREVTHGPSRRTIIEKNLNREGLYDTSVDIENRNWPKILKMKDGSFSGFSRLHERMRKDCTTNRPVLKKIDRLLSIQRRPLMICEYGFGDTTFKLLDWCVKNDAYLVTVEMPIAPEEVRNSDAYKELYWWGVDRYHAKYDYCLELLNHPVARKRWLWVMDDCYRVTDRISKDEGYRRQLFLDGKIDYFYEDAIHDNKFHSYLFGKIRPYMNSGGVFTGDDNTPTILI